MRTNSPFRVVFALALLTCLLALLLMPGTIAAVMVQSNPSGKQFVRVFGLLSMMLLAAGACCGALRIPFSLHVLYRQVYVHGFGPDLLDKTCARLC